MLYLLIPCMFAVAVVFSMLGLGGGILYTPIQVFAGVEFSQAASTSLFLIMVTSVSASIVFARARKIDWPLVVVLECATVPGAYLGGIWSNQFSEATLAIIFACFVGIAAPFMIRGPRSGGARRELKEGPFYWNRRIGDQTYRINLGIALPVSLLAGCVCGLVGVGGGLMKIPMMVLLFGIPMDIVVGSSALMIAVTSAAGLAGHVSQGAWGGKTTLVLAIAVFVGGQIGSRISIRLEKATIRRAFGWFLLVVVTAMIGHAVKSRLGPESIPGNPHVEPAEGERTLPSEAETAILMENS